MKKFILSTAMLAGMFAMAQTGINTTAPKATLDITAKNSDGSTPEGLLVPRLDGVAINSMPTSNLQKSTMIYALSAAYTAEIAQLQQQKSALEIQLQSLEAQYNAATDNAVKDSILQQYYDVSGQYANVSQQLQTAQVGFDNKGVDAEGYYYWDGAKWIKFVNNDQWKLTGNAGTDQSANFIGTTDLKNLSFRVNNEFAGVIIPQSSNAGAYMGYKSNLYGGNGTTAFGNFDSRPDAIAGTNGIFNTIFGQAYFAGSRNTLMGYWIGYKGKGSDNVIIGGASTAAYLNGDYNIILGHGAMISDNVAGNNMSHSIIIGANANITENIDYQLAIGGWLAGKGNPDNVNGKFNYQLGVNLPTSLLSETLDVAGNIRVRSNASTAGAVGASVTAGSSCPNLGTISFGTDGNFYGCTGTASPGVWKQLNN